jgi:hypothetical protein
MTTMLFCQVYERKDSNSTHLVRVGLSIGPRYVTEECVRTIYRPISFKLYNSRTFHRMLEIFTQLQRAPHLVP